ncbi:MAG: hypothetical protein HYV26_19975 [Candidatus Hydrogenedentes bacterium]|nr:hypothetical protein [Candidatus Hydrogenedentota bacterium]
MRLPKTLLAGLVILSLLPLGGCARAARDTTGFSQEQNITVSAPFEQTWQTVKAVLREKGLELYTRDKRGVFVAYTPMKRRLFQPKRVKYTIELAEVSSNETGVYVEMVNQVYGVTLLTYPGWHDRPAADTTGASEILSAVQARISGGTPESVPAAPASS